MPTMQTQSSTPKDKDLASYIVFQRTDLGRLSQSRFLKRWLGYNRLVGIDGALFHGSIMEQYRVSMGKEWQSMVPYIDHPVNSVMDIGCGIAGLHEYSFRDLSGNKDWSLTLVDRNKTDEAVYYNFKADGSAYNSLHGAKSYLASRGVPEAQIHLVDVEKDSLPNDRKYDLIISMISWGFHYPVETYLDYTKKVLADTGSMILDVRKDTGGVEALNKVFHTDVILDEPKYQRIRCRHRS